MGARAASKPPQDLRASTVRVGSRSYVLLSHRRGEAHDPLTPAEREVALAILEGLSNDEIARLRGTSTRTVANQVATIFRKLNVKSRAELAVRRPTRG